MSTETIKAPPNSPPDEPELDPSTPCRLVVFSPHVTDPRITKTGTRALMTAAQADLVSSGYLVGGRTALVITEAQYQALYQEWLDDLIDRSGYVSVAPVDPSYRSGPYGGGLA